MSEFLKNAEEIKQLMNVKGGCLASNRITVEGKKVGYAYREKPDEKFTNDSGWRFLSGDEDGAYTNDLSNFHAFELNTICNYDEAVLPILEAEIGAAFSRNEDKLVRE